MDRKEQIRNLKAWLFWKKRNLEDNSGNWNQETLESERAFVGTIDSLLHEHDKLLKYCRLAVLTHDSPEMDAIKDYLVNILGVPLRENRDKID